ncbi:hypothetical protein PAXRUDRAFT_827610 [Paxillus rubicundulus Ve08.2h10]|uniref:Uncharacterized protein n=1 Tax=Paxillus rubicundulus Ve08.2h10 TaxID=930991 RepID=A0A0D0E8C1_9AGAM|nr:hypothetical protein PAXRUDRAFT_827610 [Paxillus rubicundulus Ve08.2h10]
MAPQLFSRAFSELASVGFCGGDDQEAGTSPPVADWKRRGRKMHPQTRSSLSSRGGNVEPTLDFFFGSSRRETLHGRCYPDVHVLGHPV